MWMSELRRKVYKRFSAVLLIMLLCISAIPNAVILASENDGSGSIPVDNTYDRDDNYFNYVNAHSDKLLPQLYKFIISNGHIYYVETPYSVDPTYIWVPGKAGDYTISVLVKNRVSFGKYDAVGSFTVNVN